VAAWEVVVTVEGLKAVVAPEVAAKVVEVPVVVVRVAAAAVVASVALAEAVRIAPSRLQTGGCAPCSCQSLSKIR